MKRKLITILAGAMTVMALVAVSCRKDESYMNNAELTGWDLRMCPCCGGITLTIDNVPNPNGYSFFLTGYLPAGFNLGTNPKFPIAVKIDWKMDTTHCFGNYITITRIA